MASKIDAHFARIMLDSLRAENADGGEGSGNFNHAGRPGEVGGSAPSEGGGGSVTATKVERHTKLDPAARKLLETQKAGDFYGFGQSYEQKEQIRKQLISAFEKAGAKVSGGGDYDYYRVSSPHMSFEELSDMTQAINFSRFHGADKDEYVKQCKEAGTKPDLHRTAEEMPQEYLKKADGTPVYLNLQTDEILSKDDILKYSADPALDTEVRQKQKQTAAKVTEEWTPEQATAVKNYTSEYGPGNYSLINDYLVNGNGDERTKKAAEALTEALDHPIGVDCMTYRGIQGDKITQIVDDPKAVKIMAQIERGNYSKAAELKKMLEGRVVENPAVMSTSAFKDYKYGQRGIQMFFKTPADAKAVDVTDASAYGGGRSKELERFAALTGQSVDYESEIAYKPGTRYRIDSVDFSLTPARKGTKEKGQIFLVCSVLTD